MDEEKENNNSATDSSEQEKAQPSRLDKLKGKFDGFMNKLDGKTKKEDPAKDMKEGARGATKAASILINPAFWVTLFHVLIFSVIMLLIICVFAVIYALFTYNPINKDSNTISALTGISDDKFYGARVIYQNDDAANEVMKVEYIDFTQNLLSSSKVAISWGNQKDTLIQVITQEYLNNLLSTSNNTIDYACSQINHFGFTSEEVTIVIDSIASSIKYYKLSSKETTEIKDAITVAYEQSFAYMNNVCPKLFVKDYILKSGGQVENMSKENYSAYIFMPKTETLITASTFVLAPDENQTVTAQLKQKQGLEVIDMGEEATADSSWVTDDEIVNSYEADDLNLTLPEFTAIDANNLNYLSEGLTIFQMLKDSKFDIYFTVSEGLNTITAEQLAQSVNTNQYLFLQTSATSPFLFAEYLTDYE